MRAMAARRSPPRPRPRGRVRPPVSDGHKGAATRPPEDPRRRTPRRRRRRRRRWRDRIERLEHVRRDRPVGRLIGLDRHGPGLLLGQVGQVQHEARRRRETTQVRRRRLLDLEAAAQTQRAGVGAEGAHPAVKSGPSRRRRRSSVARPSQPPAPTTTTRSVRAGQPAGPLPVRPGNRSGSGRAHPAGVRSSSRHTRSAASSKHPASGGAGARGPAPRTPRRP